MRKKYLTKKYDPHPINTYTYFLYDKAETFVGEFDTQGDVAKFLGIKKQSVAENFSRNKKDEVKTRDGYTLIRIDELEDERKDKEW